MMKARLKTAFVAVAFVAIQCMAQDAVPIGDTIPVRPAVMECDGFQFIETRRVEVITVEGQSALRLPADGMPNQHAWAKFAGVSLTDGTIEFQMRDEKPEREPGRGNSHAGIALAVKNDQTFDTIYFSPAFSLSKHNDQSGKAVKNVPAENGQVNWQKYLKSEYIADAEISADVWTDYRIEVKNNAAKVFVGSETNPAVTFRIRSNDGANGVAIWAFSSSKKVLIRNLNIAQSFNAEQAHPADRE